MEAGFIILAVALIIIVAAGLYLFIWRGKTKTKKTDTQGMLNIVYDQFGNNPQLVLALYDPVETVAAKKRVMFDVNIIHQDSRK